MWNNVPSLSCSGSCLETNLRKCRTKSIIFNEHIFFFKVVLKTLLKANSVELQTNWLFSNNYIIIYFSWTWDEQVYFSLSILILVQISPSFPVACFSYNTLYFVSTGVNRALAMHNMELNVHRMRKMIKIVIKATMRVTVGSHGQATMI